MLSVPELVYDAILFFSNSTILHHEGGMGRVEDKRPSGPIIHIVEESLQILEAVAFQCLRF